MHDGGVTFVWFPGGGGGGGGGVTLVGGVTLAGGVTFGVTFPGGVTGVVHPSNNKDANKHTNKILEPVMGRIRV
jgi:hypothetical protein